MPGADSSRLFHGYHVSQVKKGSEKLMWADGRFAMLNVWGSGVHPGWDNKVSSYDRLGDGTPHFGSPAPVRRRRLDATRTIAWRHRKGANVCFFDGHVEWLHKSSIYKSDPATGAIVANMALWDVMQLPRVAPAESGHSIVLRHLVG